MRNPWIYVPITRDRKEIKDLTFQPHAKEYVLVGTVDGEIMAYTKDGRESINSPLPGDIVEMRRKYREETLSYKLTTGANKT